ncbi:hypothetical protein, partial [Escherichia coli]
PFATLTPPAGTGLAGFQRIFPAATDPRTGAFLSGPGVGDWKVGAETGLPTAPGSTLPVNGIATPYWLSRDAVFSSDLYGKRERPSVNAA